MTHTEVEELVRELFTAQKTGQMVTVLPSSRPGFDLNAAYEVEALLKRMREAGGHKMVGRKVGYANKAMWRVLKLETLVWAHMYDDTVHYSDQNRAKVALSPFRSLKIEPEIVFALRQPLVPENLDATAVLESTEWLAMGFEIIDCPFPDWKFQPGDFVASFGLHAALVVGEKIPVEREAIPKLIEELPQFQVRMSKNGEFVEEGSGKNSLRSPALCVAELAGAIVRRFPTQPLSAGELISTGTLTSGHATHSGDRWTAEITGLPLPSLTLVMG